MFAEMSLTSRWSVLALLFAVRTTMGFQFQSVAALAPLVRSNFGVSLADLGLLIGLYLAPGIVLALPGGDIGRRYGDKTVVAGGLVLMVAGGLIMALSPTWSFQLGGRLVAGIGGVLLNVSMSKMVTDWFAGREIATAMAVFVNSWPCGIALALLVLPFVGTAFGVSAAFLVATALVALGLIALAALYRSPASAGIAYAAGTRPDRGALIAVILAGLSWGLFNAGLGMIFAFGPTLLAERGWSLGAASSTTSLVLWLVVVSVPVGGIIADRTGRPLAILFGSCIAFGLLLMFAARTDAVLPAFVALGLVGGLPAGPIMSMPARVLTPATRAVGMGVFFTLFYVLIVLGPWMGGEIANAVGTARVTFDLGAAMLALCCAVTWAFRRMSVQMERDRPAVTGAVP
jgi:predicted MFS family arabinose efflux permease